MKSKFLVNLNKDERGKWVAKCISARIQVEAISKEETLAKINKQFKHFLASEANSYIADWKGDQNIVTCPEGKLFLPIDIWKCKLNEETCPTQAQVFLDQEDEFRLKCSADENKKENILKAIKGNIYDGFHHIPGRGKCVLCRCKKSFRYHYPWELNYLYQYLDIFNDDLRVEFVKSGIDLSAYSFGLCPDCFIKVTSRLKSFTEGTFKKMELKFYR